MRPIVRWVFAAALLPSTLCAAVLRDPEPPTAGPDPMPRPGDRSVAYVVVTDRQLQGAFMPLVDQRTRGGLNAAVVTIESIEQSYPAGVDLAERIRMFLKDAHANWRTQWVLLGGDASVIPMRRAHLPYVAGGVGIDLPIDQYYACLDGSWNADGDSLWGENPLPGEPGDDVDFFPDLFVGRAAVRNPREAADFVRRTLVYEERLAAAGPRSALLAAEVFGGGFIDGARYTERLRPALEADPGRGIVRLYENSAGWPGATHESRPALLDALNRAPDLAVLVGAGGHGVFVAGEDDCCEDYVTSDDLLGLTNAPQYAVVYGFSAFTTDPDDPLSIGAALMRAEHGGAAAVLGTTDLQFISIGGSFMREFFDEALGPTAPPIGEALAHTIAAFHSQSTFDGVRLTTRGMVLLGDPALRLDPAGALVAAGAAGVGETGPETVAGLPSGVGDPRLATTGLEREAASRASASAQTMTGAGRVGAPAPVVARSAARLSFDLPREATGARYHLVVFDVLGRRVRALAEGMATSGRIELGWDLVADDGKRVPSGIYLARLSLPGTSLVTRVLVLE